MIHVDDMNDAVLVGLAVEADAEAMFAAVKRRGVLPWAQQPQSFRDHYCVMARAVRARYVGMSNLAMSLSRLPRDPGPCEGDESAWLLAFMRELHAHLPEDQRPKAWMDFSDDQRARIKAAYLAMVDAAP